MNFFSLWALRVPGTKCCEQHFVPGRTENIQSPEKATNVRKSRHCGCFGSWTPNSRFALSTSKMVLSRLQNTTPLREISNFDVK